MIIGYQKGNSVYYQWGNRSNILVASNARFVSVSGNYIVYEKNGRTYKAEVDQNGYIVRNNILVA